MPADIRLQIGSRCKKPPESDGWLHEIEHDRHRLLVKIRIAANLCWSAAMDMAGRSFSGESFRLQAEAAV